MGRLTKDQVATINSDEADNNTEHFVKLNIISGNTANERPRKFQSL